MLTDVYFTDAEGTQGRFTFNGRVWEGLIPPEAGDLRLAWDAWEAQGGVPVPYAPQVPQSPSTITAAQAKVALYRKGLLDSVEQAVLTYPRDIQLWYQEAREWDRMNPYVLGIGMELGLTDNQVDELFAFASTLAA